MSRAYIRMPKCMYMKCLQYGPTLVMIVMTVMQNGDGDDDDLGQAQYGEGNDDSVDDVNDNDDKIVRMVLAWW